MLYIKLLSDEHILQKVTEWMLCQPSFSETHNHMASIFLRRDSRSAGVYCTPAANNRSASSRLSWCTYCIAVTSACQLQHTNMQTHEMQLLYNNCYLAVLHNAHLITTELSTSAWTGCIHLLKWDHYTITNDTAPKKFLWTSTMHNLHTIKS